MTGPTGSDLQTTPDPLAPGTPGVMSPSDRDRQGAFLTDVIVDLGFADRAKVEEAVAIARRTATSPERWLLDTGAIDEHRLSVAMAERNGLEHVDLENFAIDPSAAATIAPSIATRYTALPIAFAADGALVVAIEDPYDMLGISDIEVVSQSEVRPVVATGRQIRDAIEQLPSRSRNRRNDAVISAGEARRDPPPAPPPEPVPPRIPEPMPEPVPEPTPPKIPEPEPERPPEPQPEPEPEPAPVPTTENTESGLAETVAALRQSAQHALTLAAEAERRLAEHEDARAHADDLERQLAEAHHRIADLESRLEATSEAAREAKELSERLIELAAEAAAPPPRRTHS